MTHVHSCPFKAWEGILLAQSGALTEMGFNRTLMGHAASYTPLPLASAYASSLACLAITMALTSRELDGIGDTIEVPLASALCEALIYNSMSVENLPSRYRCFREYEIERRKVQLQLLCTPHTLTSVTNRCYFTDCR